jgi:AcrR family transcriptional regulator
MTDSAEDIMDATYLALVESGYAGLSISHIADHFDGSQSLIYYHYEDKEELLVAFLEYLLDGLETELETISTDDPAERFRSIVDLLLPDADDPEAVAFQQALIEMRVQTPYHHAYDEQFQRLDDRLETLFRDAIGDARANGAFSDVDPERAARQLLTEIYGIHYRHVPMEESGAISDARTRIDEQIAEWES